MAGRDGGREDQEDHREVSSRDAGEEGRTKYLEA